MKENIDKRIKAILSSETPEDLKKSVCPFFVKGGYSECATCRKTDADLEECRDYYLERIKIIPLELWSEEFDKVIVQTRDKVSLEEITGLGINCDSCYMYDKCPLYKKGYICGIKWDGDRPKNSSEFMDFLINTQYERVKRSALFEKIDGGVPDAGLSGELDRLHGLIASKNDMSRDRLSINVEATSSTSSTGGGILAKLFGGGGAALPDSSHERISTTISSKEGAKEVEAELVKLPREKRK